MGDRLRYESLKFSLKLPGTYLSGPAEPYSEEELFLRAAVFTELDKRISSDPIKVFQYAMSGKLVNSLTVAVLNDLRDGVRFLRAKKRDITAAVFFSQIETQDEDGDSVPFEELIPDQAGESHITDIDEKLSFKQRISRLPETQQIILTLKFDEKLGQKEIADKLGKSEPWVTVQ